MSIELTQVMTKSQQTVDLWLDTAAIEYVGADETNPDASVFAVEAALVLEGEPDADANDLICVRLSIGRDGAKILPDTSLKELEDAVDAVADDGDELPASEESADADDENKPGQQAYQQSLIKWFEDEFTGFVYHADDYEQALPGQVTLSDFAQPSNLLKSPDLSWDVQARLHLGTGEVLGPYTVKIAVDGGVPYAYLAASSFNEVSGAMLGVAGPTAPPSADVAVALLLTTLDGTAEARRQLFYRIGSDNPIDDYELDVADRDSIRNQIGNPLEGERGWWIDLHLRSAPPADGLQSVEVAVTDAKLLISADDKQVWIEISPDQI
ncbi:MAG TPA: hypothetical protein VFQ44_03425 [Streptosporangiaceae bacterium]|nr:hypothetical protein [Streptosporangiaceae bacterium]